MLQTFVLFYPSSTHVRALSQILLHIFLLPHCEYRLTKVNILVLNVIRRF
jgi:hypothetical protein